MNSVIIHSESRIRHGRSRGLFALVFTALIFCVACAGMGGSHARRWDDCSPLPDQAYFELVSCCGERLEVCPSMDRWLSDMEALCRALH